MSAVRRAASGPAEDARKEHKARATDEGRPFSLSAAGAGSIVSRPRGFEALSATAASRRVASCGCSTCRRRNLKPLSARQSLGILNALRESLPPAGIAYPKLHLEGDIVKEGLNGARKKSIQRLLDLLVVMMSLCCMLPERCGIRPPCRDGGRHLHE